MKNIHLLKGKRKIFVGADFQKLQYIWLIHIIHSYCKQNQFIQLFLNIKKMLKCYFDMIHFKIITKL